MEKRRHDERVQERSGAAKGNQGRIQCVFPRHVSGELELSQRLEILLE